MRSRRACSRARRGPGRAGRGPRVLVARRACASVIAPFPELPMRTLAFLLAPVAALGLVPCALAQDPAAAPAPAAEPPQLVTPNPVPGEKLPEGAEWKTTAT